MTGAAGFIGSRVCELLLEDGQRVVGLDNLCDSYDVRLKKWRLARLQGKPGFDFIEGDICDCTAVEQVFLEQLRLHGPFDGLINLAARAGVRYSVENPWIYLDVNTTGTLNLLELARRHQVRKFILASTSSLYGKNNPMPFKEDACTDQPFSPYAASKKAAEVMCYTYHHLYGLDVTVFRYFTVYGPAGRPDMSPFRFACWIREGLPLQLFGDGSYTRDFTFIDDIARGTIQGLKPLGYEVINLGNDQPHTMLEMIHLLEELTGKKADLQYKPPLTVDMPATWADIHKARALLGWEPQVPLKEGLARLVDWYNAERSWANRVICA